MKNKDNSERVLFRSEKVNDEVYRVTKNGTVATLWRCRSSGVWRELTQLSLEDFEAWAVRVNLPNAHDGGFALLSTLADKVKEEVNND